MMRDFHCDVLYAMLCRKQNCFRARLTPKPRRMKMPGWKVKYPRTEDEDKAFREWLAKYESASRNYRVCKFLDQLGGGFSTEAVRVHDEIAGVRSPLPLA
jgi:hypothetical protein